MRGAGDAFITKLTSSGVLVYSTYIGGSSDQSESGNFGIAIDLSNNVYISGLTYSADFPTLNAFQAVYGGNRDVFIVKLTSNGTVAYSTYLGGSLDEGSTGIAVDGNGDAFVTGYTTSTNFPTLNADQTVNVGGDAFVAKLTPAGALVYSTFFGGSNYEFGYGIALDANSNAYVMGGTNSTNFPTLNAAQGVSGGGYDSFVTKLYPLGLAPATLPNLTSGISYSQAFTANSGTAPYTFAVTEGTLPTGLGLSSAGVLSGIPTTAASYPFNVTVTDAQGLQTSRSYTVTTNSGPFAGFGISGLLGGATAGTPLAARISALDAGGNVLPSYTGTVTLTSSDTQAVLPPTYTFTAADAGQHQFTVTFKTKAVQTLTASDPITNGGHSSTGNVSVISGSATTLTKTAGDNQSTLIGTSFSSALRVKATDAYGNACSGVSIQFVTPASGASCTLNGVGSTVTISTDASGLASANAIANMVSGTYNVNASGPSPVSFTLANTAAIIAVTPSSLATATAGLPFSQAFNAANGVAPYTFSLFSGALPVGLSLSTIGTLSGTPTIAGSFNFTVAATDANGAAGSRAYTLTLSPPVITMTPTTLPNGQGYVAYPTTTLLGAGGVGPYTFMVTTGALPSGITLASAGVLSGTPLLPGTFTFTATAMDVHGFKGSKAYTIVIPTETSTIKPTPATLPNIKIKVAYTQQMWATGGKGNYTFRLTAGALPTGLTLAPGGLISGTPTVAATFKFTLIAIDGNGFNSSPRAYSMQVKR